MPRYSKFKRRRGTYIRGRGAYKIIGGKAALGYAKSMSGITKGKNILPMAGAIVGGGLGSLFSPAGTLIGSGLGMAAGHIAGRITGLGDYRINSNTLMGNDPPRVRNIRGQGFVIRHREFIQDVSSSDVFAIQSFPLNPGQPQTFPWLSEIANQFEEWVPLGIVFEFKSTSADALNSTNTALGTIIMATNYNSGNPAFSNKQQMENYEYATSSRPSCSALHPVECDPRQNPEGEYYVRSGAVPTNQDARLYDLGNFFFGAVGSQAIATVGELWVTYEILLRKPRMQDLSGAQLLSDHYSATAGLSNSLVFGTKTKTTTGRIINIDPALNQIQFTPGAVGGTYMLVWVYKGTSVTIVKPSITLSNCISGTAQMGFANFGQVAVDDNSTACNQLFWNQIIFVSGQGATVTFGAAGTLPSAPTSTDLYMLQINAGFGTAGTPNI